MVADNALPAYEWVRDYIGVKFDRLAFHGGHSVPRSAAYMKGNGAKLVKPLVEKCKSLGIPILSRTRLAELVTKDGAVLGAEVEEGYRFPKEGSGKKAFYRAKKGIVLAGGGFSSRGARSPALHLDRICGR